jgi:hypothetical protein
MPTCQRNMLSPASVAEVTRQGIRGLIYVLKSKGRGKGADQRDGILEWYVDQ